jgi:hypothetical protein
LASCNLCASVEFRQLFQIRKWRQLALRYFFFFYHHDFNLQIFVVVAHHRCQKGALRNSSLVNSTRIFLHHMIWTRYTTPTIACNTSVVWIEQQNVLSTFLFYRKKIFSSCIVYYNHIRRRAH